MVLTEPSNSSPASDRLATTNTTLRAPAPYRYPPSSLLLTDTVLSLRNFFYLHTIVWPLWTTNPRGELYLWSRGNLVTLALHAFYVFLGLAGFALAPLWLCMTGRVWLLYAVGYFAVVWAVAQILNRGGKDARSAISAPGVKEVPDEKWVFVNGVMAGSWWVQSAVDELARRFGRPVTAIHNRTFGVVLDLVQCLIQRDVGLTGGCVKETYKQLRTYLLQRDQANPQAWRYRRIVVVAHSQGGLVTSLALDMLFADLADEVLSRLEIYTFGNAANHFNNPPNTYTPDDGTRIQFPTIRHIEHYANEFDFVSRLGVLAYHPGPSQSVGESDSEGEDESGAPKFLEWTFCGRQYVQEGSYHNTGMEYNQFAGKLFMRPGHGGHQFVMHYLDEMFKSGDEGEPVFVPVRPDSKRSGEDDVGRPSVEKTGLEETSRLWAYRGGRVPAGDRIM